MSVLQISIFKNVNFWSNVFLEGLAGNIALASVGPTQVSITIDGDPGHTTILRGSGFSENGSGVIVSGTIDTIDFFDEFALTATMTDIGVPAMGFLENVAIHNGEFLPKYDAIFGVRNLNFDASPASGGRGLFLEGGGGDDTLTGSDTTFNVVAGGIGDDTYIGSVGRRDIINYFNETGANGIVIDLAAGTGTDTYGDVETFDANIDNVGGSFNADMIVGNALNNDLAGLGGPDVIDGGAGSDFVNYSGETIWSQSMGGVVVNLANGTGQDTFGSTDTLINIENVHGTSRDDVITGDSFDNEIADTAGTDILDGGGGIDTLRFDRSVNFLSIQGVYADLESGEIVDAWGNAETIANFENANGTINDDHFVASSGGSRLQGGGGNDTLEGGVSADVLDGGVGDDMLSGGVSGDTLTGGDGIDTASYAGSFEGVVVNLDAGGGTGTGQLGDAQGDLLYDIENLTGSDHRDFLFGTQGENIINGEGGIDVMQGFGGNDVYAVDNSSDAVIEATGGGFDNVYASIDYIIPEDSEIESALITATATVLRGSDSDNQLIGNDEVNVIDGRGGTDYMLGGLGNDIFQIGPEDGAVDIIGDFTNGGPGMGDRIAFTGFNEATSTVTQVSAVSFIIEDTSTGTSQQFQLFDAYGAAGYTGGELVAGEDYYFG
ncbi:MAG: calcium-binding protein [Pseudomonadota bacterium]